MSEWQPIETAPKDGRSIWLFGTEWTGRKIRAIGHWAKTSDPAFGRDTSRWTWHYMDIDEKAATITHWMPVQDFPEDPA